MDKTQSRICGILNLTKEIPKEKMEYIDKLFQDAPLWLIDCITIQKLGENEVFVRENTPVDKVFIMIDGNVTAVDHRIFGIEYDYVRFKPVSTFGSMEILLDIDTYKTTLKTTSECTFLVLKKNKFKEWIEKDINALLMETKGMGLNLLEQGRRERAFLFLGGMDRLMMVLTKNYEYLEVNGKCVLSMTRQELSDCSGLSIKTINRAVKKLEDEEYISRNGNKIVIDSMQYENMREYINGIIAQD